MEITFNTSRLYTARGQVVTARFDAEAGKVWFKDHSRMVDGSYTVDGKVCEVLWTDKPEAFAKAVMRRYDAGGTYDCPVEDYHIARNLREGDTILTYRI